MAVWRICLVLAYAPPANMTSNQWFRVYQVGAGFCLGLVILLAPPCYFVWREHHVHNFHIVQDGVLYRSAQLSPQGLQRVIHDYQIKTVVSFRFADHGDLLPQDAWEESVCAENGVRFVRIQPDTWLPDADRTVSAKGWQQFLEVTRNRTNQPILAHCLRGVHRTGTYCALYRIECQGWCNAAAIEELKALGYHNLDREGAILDYLRGYKPNNNRQVVQ